MSNSKNSLQRIAAVLCLVLFSALGVRVAHAADLVVAAFGGIWEESLRQCYIAPFEKLTGKKVDVVLGQPSQWLHQVAASPAKPPIDVMFIPPDNALEAGKLGLVDKLDAAKTPHLKEIPQQFVDSVDGWGAAINYGAMGVLYNSKTVANPPKNWKEYVEGTVAGKWKTSMPSINYLNGSNILWMYARLYGGSVTNIGPGMAQVKRMIASGNMKLWVDANQVLNDLKSGEIDLAMYWDGRAWAFIDTNPDFKYYTPPDSVAVPSYVQKIKNAPDYAWQFLDVVMSAEPEACFAGKIRYGVTNKNVVYDPKIKPQITELKLVTLPPKDIEKYKPQWVEQWNKEIGR